jgi:dynein light intermediate chain 1, cytosolic
VLEHIGPVQFNMGGIQVDADDMVQRLMVSLACSLPTVMFESWPPFQDRQAYGSSTGPPSPHDDGVIEESPQMDTENLQAFFTGLMNRRPGTGV